MKKNPASADSGTADMPIPAAPKPHRNFINTDELRATILPASRRTILDLRKKNIIPSIRLGSKILFHVPSVEAALLRRQKGGAI